MKLSTTFWVITILLLLSIGEGLYIYYTRPQPDPELSNIIAASKAKDSIITARNDQIIKTTTELVFEEAEYDELYRQRKGLSDAMTDAGAIINNLSDSLDVYRAMKDTPRFIVACDTLQIKADSLVARTVKYESIIKVGDAYFWLVGRQKDSVNFALQSQVLTLKNYDSAVTHQLLVSLKANQKITKSNQAMKPLYIGGGVVGGVLLTALVHFVIK